MRKTLYALAFGSAGLVVAPSFAQDTTPQNEPAANQSATSPQQTSTPAYDQTAGDTSNGGGNYQSAQPVGSGNWFIDANVGRTNGNSNGGFGSNASSFNFFNGHRGRRTGYGLAGGYRWKVGHDLGLGVEAGYTDLGNYRIRNVFNSSPVNQRDTVNALRGWMVGVNGRINLTPQWYVGAHGGWFRANDNNNRYYDTLGQQLGFSNGKHAGRSSWYAGVGTGWDINEHFGVGVQYDYFHANAGHYTNPATGERVNGLKRSTGIVSLTGEYRF
jgi:OOP family OmpA-OmpF porin/outer membrane immunogenic protein